MATTAPRLPALDVSHVDDPRVVEEAATEDYSLHAVPHTWRMDRGQLAMAWFGVATAFFYMYFAAFLALAYGTVNAVIGLVLSVVAYSLVNAVIARVAADSGLTVALFSRGMMRVRRRLREGGQRRDESEAGNHNGLPGDPEVHDGREHRGRGTGRAGGQVDGEGI